MQRRQTDGPRGAADTRVRRGVHLLLDCMYSLKHTAYGLHQRQHVLANTMHLVQAGGQRQTQRVVAIPASALSSNQNSRGHARPPAPHSAPAIRSSNRLAPKHSSQTAAAAAPSAVTHNVMPSLSLQRVFTMLHVLGMAVLRCIWCLHFLVVIQCCVAPRHQSLPAEHEANTAD